VSVNISFTEPCIGGGGFGCKSVNACNVSRWLTKVAYISEVKLSILLCIYWRSLIILPQSLTYCFVISVQLLVYGAGQVIPSSFRVLQPNLTYSLLVSLSSTVQYGRAILVMDRNFCTDLAGNNFMRMPNSSVYIHFGKWIFYYVIAGPTQGPSR